MQFAPVVARRGLRERRAASVAFRWLKPFQLCLCDMPLPRPVALTRMLGVILATLGLSACESVRPYERASDGSTVYLDQLSDTARTAARQNIVGSLNQGIGAYELKDGDQIEIFFHTNRRPTPGEYAIRAGDKLRVEFLSESETAQSVQVRPDGQISLPLIGSVTAMGRTAGALAHELQQRYSGALPGAQITVNVTESHSPLEDFLEVVGAPNNKGRSLVDKVLPDGTISLPLLSPLKVRGRTLPAIENEIDAAYSALGLDVFVSIIPRGLRPDSTFVLGEVFRPGRIELERPQTVLMVVAQAGGVTTKGSMSSVRLLYVGEDGMPRVRSINLEEVVDDLRLEEDMIVPDNSVIYVPTTELAKIGLFLDQVLRDILRFQGFSFFGNYLINQTNPGSQTVITRPTP
jgi:protein involved in polysaccharide export with SLBB domain